MPNERMIFLNLRLGSDLRHSKGIRNGTRFGQPAVNFSYCGALRQCDFASSPRCKGASAAEGRLSVACV